MILIPLTFVAVNFFFTKVETAHMRLAPHHYQPIPPPQSKELNWYWKQGYTALANKDYERAIIHFNDLTYRSTETTFGWTGLISIYYERCRSGHNSSCELLFKTLENYKRRYHIKGEDDTTIIQQINNFTNLQIEKVLCE